MEAILFDSGVFFLCKNKANDVDKTDEPRYEKDKSQKVPKIIPVVYGKILVKRKEIAFHFSWGGTLICIAIVETSGRDSARK